MDTDITNDKTVLQNEKLIGQEQGQDSGVCGFGCSGSTSFNVEGKPLDLIAMTFCRKPPTPDSKDGQFENASRSSPTIPDHSYLVDEENHEGVSGCIFCFLEFFSLHLVKPSLFFFGIGVF